MSEQTEARRFLVTGATGKQGGAVVKQLLAQASKQSTPIKIFALTRNASSATALQMNENPSIVALEGSASEADKIFYQTGPVEAVFLVTVPGKEGDEEKQAYPLIDEALKNGVKHVVFSSVDRGGPGVSEKNPTEIAHFASKHRIEEYIKEKTAGTQTTWTFLRPVAFMDNFDGAMFGKMFAAMWDTSLQGKSLQLIATSDIGYFAAAALLDPKEYDGRAISLAGDDLTLDQAKKIFRDTTGNAMPQTWAFMGKALMWAVAEVGTMFTWFRTDGYGADVAELKRENPQLKDFATWLRTESKYMK